MIVAGILLGILGFYLMRKSDEIILTILGGLILMVGVTLATLSIAMTP